MLALFLFYGVFSLFLLAFLLIGLFVSFLPFLANRLRTICPYLRKFTGLPLSPLLENPSRRAKLQSPSPIAVFSLHYVCLTAACLFPLSDPLFLPKHLANGLFLGLLLLVSGALRF